MVSILLLTLDRYDLSRKCVEQSLANVDYPYELLCVDNGSKDRRIVDCISDLKPFYHRLNSENMGVARMQNQMMLRARGEYLCILDSDMLMPPGWLHCLAENYAGIPESGISGIHSVAEVPSPRLINGRRVFPTLHVMGGMRFFSRAFVNRVGYLDEEFHPYGYEDVVLHVRSQSAGYVNYYAGLGAQHLGPSPDAEVPRYRDMKKEAVSRLAPQFQTRVQRIKEGQFYTPPPLLE